MPSTGDSFNNGSDLKGQYDFYAWITTVAAGNGVWFAIDGAIHASIHTKTLLTGDALVVQLSNSPDKPADTVDGVTDVTISGSGAEQFTLLTKLPARYCKIDKTGSNGAAEAYFHGVAR